MTPLNMFEKQYSIRRFSDLEISDRHFKQETLQLPKDVVFHHLPRDETDTGIRSDDYAIRNAEGTVYVEHVQEYSTDFEPVGVVRKLSYMEDREIKAYLRDNRTLRRNLNIQTSTRSSKNILVVNYAPIQHHYLYRNTFRAPYQKWHNLIRTVLYNVKKMIQLTGRAQFIRLFMPETLPTRLKLSNLSNGDFSSETLEQFKEVNSYNVFELWQLLSEEPRAVFDAFTEAEMHKVYLLISTRDEWSSVNLYRLKGFVLETDDDKSVRSPDTVRKKLLKFLMDLYSSTAPKELDLSPTKKEIDDSETLNEQKDIEYDDEDLDALDGVTIDEDAEIIISQSVSSKNVIKGKAKSEEESFKETADDLATQGTLSGAEYRRVESLLEKQKNIEIDGVSLDEASTVTKEEYDIKPTELVKEDKGIPDDSMRFSTISAIQEQYIEKVMQKDILSMIKAVNMNGIAVTGIERGKTEDISGSTFDYKINFTPIKGVPSTVSFRIPEVKPNGTYRVGGSDYYLRWQRVDLPIRKTSPREVALTSYCSKVFVQRSEKRAYDYYRWLSHQIVALANDKENSVVSSYRPGDVFDHTLTKSPRIYGALSRKFISLNAKGLNLLFDREELKKNIHDLAKVEKGDFLCVGTYKGDPATMDGNGNIYVYKDGQHNDITTIEEWFDIKLDKAPLDIAELRIFSNVVPLGFVLGYYYGFKNLYRLLGEDPRIVPSGERMNLGNNEYVIRFANESYIFNRNNIEASLILGGYNAYASYIRRSNSVEFNRKDVYRKIVEETGLHIRYVRELKILDKMFVDPITLQLLKDRNEPETFRGLIFRAVELLNSDWHPDEGDMRYQRIRWYERFAGAVYQELIRSMRQMEMNPNKGKAALKMNPEAVFMEILKDTSSKMTEVNNPMNNLREKGDVTFSGTGGRSTQSMVERNRMYHEQDLGVISEATVDSQKVGASIDLSQNPNFVNVYGMTKPLTNEDDNGALFSPAFLLSAGADKDDLKRTVFTTIQYGSTIHAEGYELPVIRTGQERVIPYRCDDIFAAKAKGDGKVKEITDKHLIIELKDGENQVVDIGRQFGKKSDMVIPHDIVPHVKVGQKVSKGDIVSYNTNYFETDPLEPDVVIFKTACLINTVFWESSATHEDSCSIVSWAAEKMKTHQTKKIEVPVDFHRDVRNLIKVGDKVDYGDELCVVQDSYIEDEELSTETNDLFGAMANDVPISTVIGVVDKIEVFYNGDLEDMSPTLRSIARKSDKLIKEDAALKGSKVTSGKVNNMRIKGEALQQDKAVINIYITYELDYGVVDKGVFSHQLKTTVQEVYNNDLRTEDNVKIGAIFGMRSADNRIVNSYALMGTTHVLMDEITKTVIKKYRG
jgi:hypothetical protein